MRDITNLTAKYTSGISITTTVLLLIFLSSAIRQIEVVDLGENKCIVPRTEDIINHLKSNPGLRTIVIPTYKPDYNTEEAVVVHKLPPLKVSTSINNHSFDSADELYVIGSYASSRGIVRLDRFKIVQNIGENSDLEPSAERVRAQKRGDSLKTVGWYDEKAERFVIDDINLLNFGLQDQAINHANNLVSGIVRGSKSVYSEGCFDEFKPNSEELNLSSS